MCSTRPALTRIASLSLALACSTATLPLQAEPAPTDLGAYNKSVAPFLDTYCIRCHEGDDAESGFRLDDIEPLITAGQDVERWEKALEMISIGDMPPPKKKQPEKTVRRAMEASVLAELRKIDRGPDDARLALPGFGNRVDHDELFSGEHKGPASSPPRLWRKSQHIYRDFTQRQRLGKSGNPFSPHPGHGFKDYANLWADESTILSLRNNADTFFADLVDGRLVHPKSPGGKEGFRSLLTALVLSPEFVYRQELGLGETLPDGRRRLSPDEIACALAYALTDSPPDGALRQAVSDGKLSTNDDVAREVHRMLDEVDTSRFWATELTSVERYLESCPNPRVLRFFREFFGYQKVFDAFKDKQRNHHHRPLFIFKDADLFVLSVLERDRHVLEDLLTSDRYVVHYASPQQAERKMAHFREKAGDREKAMLAKGITPALGGYRGGHYFTTYGFEYETWNYPREQPFKVPNRAGMLTHPAWLVAHSGNFDTDTIRRGKWIREHLLAGVIPDIPIGVDAKLQEDPHKTLRQKLAKTTPATCWRCHKKMNPLGLPFEAYDDFGRFRELRVPHVPWNTTA